MRKFNPVYLSAVIIVVLILIGFTPTLLIPVFKNKNTNQSTDYIGSASCRDCHENFYRLWADSHHGLAMQPYTDKFASENLSVQVDPVIINNEKYTAGTGAGEGWVLQTGVKTARYPIVHVMGGKNICYFLTPMERGKLQVLPVAYDINRKQWYDTAQSAMRHFPDSTDAPLHWTDSFYTFNTSCYGCHVSQVSTNYNPEDDSYNTVWSEPGINCETCHGPAAEHAEVCTKAGKDKIPEDLKIIKNSNLTHAQINSLCGSCHAKATSITGTFMPGEKFFDHFDLATLENVDYYPDGRDLGENYTMTTWMMSPCVKAGKLDCMHCHTSSGRYRFKTEETANNACMPCHKKELNNLSSHTHHEADSEGSKCITCHMPMTEFARMHRSDHSMRPPAPAATLAFKSPNACNICHKDKDAEWSDKYVRQWYGNDYQDSILKPGHLVNAARRQDWTQLDKMLEYIVSERKDVITSTSLVRLLRTSNTEKIIPVLVKLAITDKSAFVRSAAADVLGNFSTDESISALLMATRDESRLVRIRAAANLAHLPDQMIHADYKLDLQQSTDEYLRSLTARLDSYISQYNLGNYYMAKGQHEKAIKYFEKSQKLRPDFIASYVNSAFAFNAIGENFKARDSFEKALTIDPINSAVHLNIAMLAGEMNKPSLAEKHFRKALEIDHESEIAAYNLGVILGSKGNLTEAIRMCEKAFKLHKDNPKYGYTYAFYLDKNNNTNQAIAVLQQLVDMKTSYPDVYGFLASLYQRRDQPDKARQVLKSAVDNKQFQKNIRLQFEQMMNQIP